MGQLFNAITWGIVAWACYWLSRAFYAASAYDHTLTTGWLT